MARRFAAAVTLAPVLLLLAAWLAPVAQAGGGCHGPVTPPGDGEASVVKIDGCMFYPTIARVPVGTTVRFLNAGDVPHNVTGVSRAWFSGDFSGGAEYRHAFNAPGVYPFACTLHPGMNGAIVVGGAAAAAPAPEAIGPAPAAEVSTTTPSSPADAAGSDLTGAALVGLAGLGIGTIVGALGAGAITARRRRTID